jgi:hypothetical protein
MNRGQVKRLRKELDHLRKVGKEWDALRLLQRENAVDEFRSEWDDLWRAQTRHALRTAALMDKFLLCIDEFSAIPDTADIRFMRAVGDYLDGREVSAVISGMTGLSAPAETLRRELLRQGNENASDDSKLRKLLTSFAASPGKILQKDYRQLRTLLASYPAVSLETCETLEEILTRSRKLNNASTVEFKAHGVYEPNLRAIDQDLNKAASGLPPAFSRVVVAPVLANVCVAIQRVADSNPDKGARLVLAAPFCMENLLGSDWPELRKKFQLEAGQSFSAEDRASLRKTAQNATFEERFTLVNKLVKTMSSMQDFDESLIDILVLLFKGIFKELIIRRTKISERDQRKLAMIFGPFFSKNMDYLYGSMEDLPFLLDSAAAAGCLGAASALLHTFFAVMSRDRSMIANARAMLKLLPPIQEKDVQILFGKHQELLAEDLKSLKGMLDVCRECGHELDGSVAKALDMSLLSVLIMSTLMGGGNRNSFMAMIMGPMAEESVQMCKRLIKGMECFSGNPLFSAPVELARSFPSGRISGKEFGNYLEKRIGTNPSADQVIADFIVILEAIRRASEAQRMDMPFGDMLNGSSLIKELLVVGLGVLCGKKGQVMQYSTKALTVLVDIMRKYGDSRGLERYMMLISNTAAERSAAGDEDAGKLYRNSMDYISHITKSGKKGGRRR